MDAVLQSMRGESSSGLTRAEQAAFLGLPRLQ